ncbi:hypothetical protein FRX31_010175 [Thalictrum thalictroides]|uniref:Uncharacterized protein n=1 Tax=Thalictrum thalictroides TaxID=46969 RepID=A0A7J6WS85_THATH|nr:hypothetical protein FRX31_010175 [Thalictrum thalictroides]
MASGGRSGSNSKGFDFNTDDVLCPYDDFGNQETSSNGKQTDHVVDGTNSGKIVEMYKVLVLDYLRELHQVVPCCFDLLVLHLEISVLVEYQGHHLRSAIAAPLI